VNVKDMNDSSDGPAAPPADRDPVLVPLLVITPAVAFIVTLPLLYAWALLAAVVALAAAAVVGAPVLALARTIGLRGFLPTTVLGCAAGVLPVLLWALLAPLFGESVRVSQGVPLAVASTVIGGATGGIYSSVHDSIRLAPVAVRRRVLAILVVAALIPMVTFYWIR
jgi:hypothetical protein